mmetsp:Transcript_62650/g.141347  ORF Transcript_62650/g.141347 Transcript_62650/m.141347 type:complete len:232 (-) Transcript_62650:30-725(-)
MAPCPARAKRQTRAMTSSPPSGRCVTRTSSARDRVITNRSSRFSACLKYAHRRAMMRRSCSMRKIARIAMEMYARIFSASWRSWFPKCGWPQPAGDPLALPEPLPPASRRPQGSPASSQSAADAWASVPQLVPQSRPRVGCEYRSSRRLCAPTSHFFTYALQSLNSERMNCVSRNPEAMTMITSISSIVKSTISPSLLSNILRMCLMTGGAWSESGGPPCPSWCASWCASW